MKLLMPVSLLLLLGACTTPVPYIDRPLPPQEFRERCPKLEKPVSGTSGDILQAYKNTIDEYNACAARYDKLIEAVEAE